MSKLNDFLKEQKVSEDTILAIKEKMEFKTPKMGIRVYGEDNIYIDQGSFLVKEEALKMAYWLIDLLEDK